MEAPQVRIPFVTQGEALLPAALAEVPQGSWVLPPQNAKPQPHVSLDIHHFPWILGPAQPGTAPPLLCDTPHAFFLRGAGHESAKKLVPPFKCLYSL